MTAGEQGPAALWRDIDALLARAREERPLHQSDTLLDLDRLGRGNGVPFLEILARAVDGWDGRLLLSATDDSLAPDVRPGDRLVIDAEIETRDGSLVVAFADGALTIRRLHVRGGRHWLEAGQHAPIPLGPLVAIVGVVVELRRALRR